MLYLYPTLDTAVCNGYYNTLGAMKADIVLVVPLQHDWIFQCRDKETTYKVLIVTVLKIK